LEYAILILKQNPHFEIKIKNYKSYTNIFFKYDTCLANKLMEAPKNDIKVTIDYKNSKFYKQDVETNKDLRLYEFDFITKPFYYITSSKNYIQLQYMFKGFLVVHKSAFAN
jgi:FPC/CPF motif-containing protein YcgG